MKKYILCLIVLPYCIVACKSKEDGKSTPAAMNIQLPYVAHYATDFNNDEPDSGLLLVLNSYRYWEIGDLRALRTTMGDSVFVNGSNGFKFAGPTDSLMKYWAQNRDSLSSVKIRMDVRMKNHSVLFLKVLTGVMKCIFCNVCPGSAACKAKSKINIGK